MTKRFMMMGMAALAVSAVFTGCSHDTNVYNPNAANEEFAENFENKIGEVNPNQDWNLISTRTVSVKVGGDENTTYDLYVCDANPAQNKNVSLLAVAKAQGGTTATITFSVPTVNERVYIVRGDEHQQFFVPAALNGNKYEGSFAYETTRANAPLKVSALPSDTPFNVIDTDDIYATDAPAGTEAFPADGLLYAAAETNNYVVSSGTYTPRPIYAVTYNIYVKGDVKFDFTYLGNAKVNIYVVSGTLTVTGTDAYDNADGIIAVSPKATLSWERSATSVPDYTRLVNTLGGSFTIYNRGTFNVVGQKLGLVDNTTIYNEGTLNALKGLTVIGGTERALLYNVGEEAELNTSDLMVSTNGHFLNSGGKVTVDNATKAGDGTDKVWWINDGHYTTGSLDISQNNKTFYNYCSLKVNGNLTLHGGGGSDIDGNLHLLENSYLEAATAEIHGFTVLMGKNAGFNITGNSKWLAKGSDYQGFKAESDQAYVHLGGTTTVNSHVKNLQASGNVAIAIDNIVIENEGYDEDVIDITNGAAYVNFTAITPNETRCGATWTIGGGIDPTYTYYTIAFEDLGSTDDFDFNDVVLEIAHDAANNKANVSLVAAGGTLSVEVLYNGEKLFEKTDGVMNTARGIYGSKEGITLTSADDLKKFSLHVKDGESSKTIASASVKGKAPQALIIPGQWAWPTERINIVEAYPEFSKWVENVTNTDWYLYPTQGKTVE